MSGTNQPRTLRWRVALATTIVAAISATATPPALATGSHGFLRSFGGPCAGPGGVCEPAQFNTPSGVAVNNATGEVYVADSGDDRVEYFSATGAYLGQFDGEHASSGELSYPEGIAIDNNPSSPSHGDVYVIDTGHNVIDKFSPTGEFKSELTETEGAAEGIIGVAVDPSGNVWMYTRNGQAIEFNAEGDYVINSSFRAKAGSSPGLATDPSDDLYIITGAHFARRITPPEETGIAINESGKVQGIAVDDSTGDLYVDLGTVVAHYSPLGESLIEEFGSGQLVSGIGLAVNASNETVYVADSASNEIDIYIPREGPEAPNATAPVDVTSTTAKLDGELNPGGETGQVEYAFSYNAGASCTGGQSIPAPAGLVAEAKNAAVEVTVTGLQPDTEYTYCLTATNQFGSTVSTKEASFTTLSEPPVISAESVHSVAQTEAELTGLVDPSDEVTHWFIEYSTSSSLATPASVPAPEGTIAANGGQTQVSQQLTGLIANTLYYWRVIASNTGGGKSEGAIETLLTRPAIPNTEAGTEVTDTQATLNGSFNPDGQPISYYFEYGTTPCTPLSCGTRTAKEGPVEGTSGQAATASVEQLNPLTTYHYRIVVENPSGPSYGPEMLITTLPQPAAAITDTPVSISADAAVLTGEVVPHCVAEHLPPTTYHFELGTTTSYGNESEQTAVLPTSCAANGETVTLPLTGLSPDTVYHYRLDAKNSDGESLGEDRTFTTASPGETSPGLVPPGFSLVGSALRPPPPAPSLNLTGLAPIPAPKATRRTTKHSSTRAEDLAKALQKCRHAKARSKHKRASCENTARSRYGMKRKTRR